VTDRVCYGIELNPKYADVTVLRWQTQSGKKATLEGDGRTFDEIARERVATSETVRELSTVFKSKILRRSTLLH